MYKNEKEKEMFYLILYKKLLAKFIYNKTITESDFKKRAIRLENRCKLKLCSTEWDVWTKKALE